MKLVVLLMFIAVGNSISEVEEVRNTFPEITSIEQANYFIELLEENETVEAKSYTAVMFFMKSKLVKFPLTKYKYFKKGKKQLDSLINNNKSNVEIRYLRFLLQSKMPEFLGYHKNIEDDYLLIINGIESSNLKSDFKIKILNNMLLVSNLSVERSKKIKQKLIKIH
ncbi:hypothetical protein [uncultured Lutibacter sp.]|uniref:hypothetical protein n=1 Tax=uncultured Lutibacter sp. TaxID=437739 RepID=UPI002618F7D8|nr:hypothetical protein [uncultured Lutibacter sp.]